MFVSLK